MDDLDYVRCVRCGERAYPVWEHEDGERAVCSTCRMEQEGGNAPDAPTYER
jgi:formylmethanofuran dehydrogenase subunit E